MEKSENNNGFTRGLQTVKETRPAADYERCRKEAKEICMTTETRYNSRSTYYLKMKGRTPLTVAEDDRLNQMFAKYGVTDWRGTANENDNQNEN